MNIVHKSISGFVRKKQQKEEKKTMKMFKSAVLVLVFIVVLGDLQAEKSEKRKDVSKKRVGIYDSRAVAVAFVGSKAFNKWLSELRAKHATAKVKGDKKQTAKLEAEAEAQQKLLHRQGFGTAPINNILEHINLIEIAKKEKIDEFVSKWNKKALAKYTSSEKIDVTMLLVYALKPNDRQLKFAKDILKKPPVSQDKLKAH